MDDRMKDRLLRDLGELARQDDEADHARFDERWDRLAAGTLTAEEEGELTALAASSPEGGEAYEAFRPLGADFQARMVAAASAELAGAPQNEPAESQARLLPFRRATRRVEVWLGAAFAVAAGVFLLIRSPASLPPLPGYSAQLIGGVKAFRGGDSSPAQGVPVFVPGSLLTLDVQPDRPVAGSTLEGRAFLSPKAGEAALRPWEKASFQSAENGGALELKGTLGQDFQLSPGDWIIWTVVTRPGEMPSARKIQDMLRIHGLQQGSWQALCDALHAKQSRPPAQWQVACADLRVEGQLPE